MNKTSLSKEEVMYEFFETAEKSSNLFKCRSKLDKAKLSLQEISVNDKKRTKKEIIVKGLHDDLEKQRKQSAEKEIRDWIVSLADKAVRLNKNRKETAIWLCTHPAKVTHSSNSGSTNIQFVRESGYEYLLSTSSVNNLIYDVAHPDNALAKASKLLFFLHKHGLVGLKPKKEQINFFKEFSRNSQENNYWVDAFSLYFCNNSIESTSSLGKQVYFPVGDQYHVISVYASSSLDHEIYERVRYKKFSESRESRRDMKFSHNPYYYFNSLGVLKTTQTNHGNASLLNGSRFGRRYMFSSSPSIWKTVFKPPINQESLFSGELDRRTRHVLKDFQKYLLSIKHKKSNKEIRDKVKAYVNEITEILFSYVKQVQEIDTRSGWSAEADRLKHSHKSWLDPYRNDNEFQQERRSGKWQNEVCKDFGKWMNLKLETDDMKFFKFEVNQWSKFLKGRLKEFERGLEVSR